MSGWRISKPSTSTSIGRQFRCGNDVTAGACPRPLRLRGHGFRREQAPSPCRFRATMGVRPDFGRRRMARMSWTRNENEASIREAVDLVRDHGEPLPPSGEDEASGTMFDRFADAKVVLLGEATHGTSEFYRARAAITKRLITQHGFNIVAVEADWPDAARIDSYVRHRHISDGDDAAFERFPTWMWRNEEVADFVNWMREHNRDIADDERAEFRGL